MKNPNGEDPHPQENIAYRCSPPNPYFLGWPTILNALGTALQAVSDRYDAGLRLRELDLQNEIALELFPVRGRLIVDNTQSNYQVLNEVRNLMQAPLDPTLATYSVFESRTGHPPSGGVAYDCDSYWGDSARILGVSEIASAIGALRFGNTGGDDGTGGGFGLKCGGDFERLEQALPYAHYQPKIIDLHFSPCRTAQKDDGGSDCDPTQWDEVNLESAKGLNGLHNFQKSYYPISYCDAQYPGDPYCGWRGYDANLANSLLMLGESQGHGLVPELQMPGNNDTGCLLGVFQGQIKNWDVTAGRNTAAGFNQSTLPNRNLPDDSPLWLIVRPWEYPQHTVTPPDPYYCNASELDTMYIPSTGTVINSAPSAVSVTPDSGSGANPTFGLAYSDPNTYLDLKLTYLLVNSGLSFANGCYIEYNAWANLIRLADDAGSGWSESVSLGEGGLQNSQCAIDPGGTQSQNGNALTLTLHLRFFTGFSGAKNVYLLAQDIGGLSSEWQPRGTWTVSTCTYSISPPSQAFSASGGNGQVGVTAGPGCAWTASSNQGWTSITAGSSGTGNGTVSYTVQANTGGSRQGTLTIAGQTFTVNQDAAQSCSYSINPTSQNFSSSGGSGSVSVTTAAGCAWTATSNQPWAIITAGASGSGNGTVGFWVESNSGGSRSATLTIAGQSFSVTQSGGSSCSYSINPPSQFFPSIGGSGSVSVTTTAGCAWSVTGNPYWVTITSGANGSGPGTVTYSVAGNTGGYRWVIFTIAGQYHGVYQDGVPANLVLSPTTLTSGTAWYQATNSITANTNSFTVSGSAEVTFKAGSVIILRPDFRATAGSAPMTFRAFIGP